MNPIVAGWIACPRCGGDLADDEAEAVRCVACATVFGARAGMLDLVDPTQKVPSEGPGDTLGMAWRRRRWDEMRGPEAIENAAYLSAIWERIRPDDRVLDLGCGPGSFLTWLADFAPDLALVGLDVSWPALEEAQRAAGQRPNIAYARASARRRLPVKDGSVDVLLRRLAPGLPEEIGRVLSPGGYYLRFTLGPGHWREIYDLVPGLPRAREETLNAERERLVSAGLEVHETLRGDGAEEHSLPAVLLAIRSNPAAFHMERVEIDPIRQLWRHNEARRERVRLTTEYAILIARKPPAATPPARAARPALEPEPAIEPPPAAEPKPKRSRATKAEPVATATAEAAADVVAPLEPDPPAPKRSRGRKIVAPTTAGPEPEPVATPPSVVAVSPLPAADIPAPRSRVRRAKPKPPDAEEASPD